MSVLGQVFAAIQSAFGGRVAVAAPPTDGYVLTYQASTGTWIASAGGGGGGGVSQLVAGSNISLSPSGGTGTVTVTATGVGAPLYGDGSDGAINLDGTNTYSGIFSTTGSAPNLVYTQLRDVNATTFVLASGKTLYPSGCITYATTSATVSGTRNCAGGAGSGATAGAAAGATGSPGGAANGALFTNSVASAGGAGGSAANGTAGASSSQPSIGGAGGAGGGAAVNTGGAGGTTTVSGSAGTFRSITVAAGLALQPGQANFNLAAGGGGGGADAASTGGGGGGGGGADSIFSPTITVGASGTITVAGGAGAAGSGTSAGGGGGGGGGIVWLVCAVYSNAGTVTAAGGAGGAKAGTGANGASGAAGQVVLLQGGAAPAAPSFSGVVPSTCGVRLSSSSTAAIDTTGTASTTSVYVSCLGGGYPGAGDQVAVRNAGDTAWIYTTVAGGSLTVPLGTLANATNYDVYVYDSSGSAAASLSAWSDAVTPPTRAVVNGVTVLASDHTRRLVGSFRTISTTATAFNGAVGRFVCSAVNQVQFSEFTEDLVPSWSSTLANAYEPMGTGGGTLAAWVRNFIQALPGQSMTAEVVVYSTGGNSNSAAVGLALDSTSAQVRGWAHAGLGSASSSASVLYLGTPGIGYHYFQALQGCSGSGSTQYYGSQTLINSGLQTTGWF